MAFSIFASSDRIGANVVLAMVLFSIAAAGLHGYRAGFWTLRTLFLSEVGAAAGIGVINCFGNLGGFLSNNTGSYRSGMLFLGGCALLASVLVLLVPVVIQRK